MRGLREPWMAAGHPIFLVKSRKKKFPKTEIFDLLRLETELFLSDVT